MMPDWAWAILDVFVIAVNIGRCAVERTTVYRVIYASLAVLFTIFFVVNVAGALHR